jgi:hypothetical protein
MNRRDKAIEYGYDLADWIGDMALAYSPVMVFAIMAMATASIALRGAIATNEVFGFAWAIATAVCVDGLWLGVWLRVRSYKVTSWTTGLRYGAMLVVALFMFLVSVAMSILITYQQVNGVTDELLAMRTLHIDSLTFIVARGFLVMLCATLAIFFRAEKQEALAVEKKMRATPAKNRAVVTVEAAPPIAIAEHSQAAQESHSMATATESVTVARSPEYEKIRECMATAIVDGKLTLPLNAIATVAGVGYSTVKKHAPTIKKELGLMAGEQEQA